VAIPAAATPAAIVGAIPVVILAAIPVTPAATQEEEAIREVAASAMMP
jgi:hypothetical protein